MITKKIGLGRGLSSLIPNKINQFKNDSVNEISINKISAAPQIDEGEILIAKGMRVIEIDVNKIKENPYQPRKSFNYEDLEDLINSIKEHGILQPLVVSKSGDETYELIAGERRLRSAKIAGLKSIPAIIREVNAQEKLELALIENIQRKNLNPLEEALAYEKLLKDFSFTQEQISKRVGKSLGVIANALRLLALPEEIKEALWDGRIDKTAGRALAGLQNSEDQLKLFRELIEKGLNVRALEKYVRSKKNNRAGKAKLIDFSIEEKKEKLEEALGTRVKIEKKGEEGKIIIEFYSEEELAGIVKKIAGEE